MNLQYSHDPVTESYPELDESSPYRHTVFPRDSF
jgi:hypothetical protein